MQLIDLTNPESFRDPSFLQLLEKLVRQRYRMATKRTDYEDCYQHIVEQGLTGKCNNRLKSAVYLHVQRLRPRKLKSEETMKRKLEFVNAESFEDSEYDNRLSTFTDPSDSLDMEKVITSIKSRNQRVAVCLYYKLGCTLPEIAYMMNCTHQTAHYFVQEGIKGFQKQMKRKKFK
jgi:DNA-directed RNA polymerase specialized sigma24 family protein